MPKPKLCKVCRISFEPRATTQVVCSWQCSIAYTNQEKAKRERKEYREKKEKLKSLREWLGEAQVVYNRYIRELKKGMPCVSCGQHRTVYDAGHYRSVGAAPQLRFTDDNVWPQCIPCNQHKSGNAIEYRIRLVKLIGQDRVEALENNNEIKKWTIEEAKSIKVSYNHKLKLLRKGVSNERN